MQGFGSTGGADPLPAAIAAHPEIADVVCVDAHGLQRFAQVLGGEGVEEEIAFNQQALNGGLLHRGCRRDGGRAAVGVRRLDSRHH